MGIGYSSPQYKLHVSGGISAILPYEQQSYVVVYDDTNGKFAYHDNSLLVTNPAGNDASIQYNNNGIFGGDNRLNWDDSITPKLIVTGSLYLTESRNIPQHHQLVYDTASGEVTFFNRTAAFITTNNNVTVDVSRTASIHWSASFNGSRVMSCSFLNTAPGTSLKVMVTNGGGNNYYFRFATEKSNGVYNYNGNRFSRVTGGGGGPAISASILIASSASSYIEITKIDNDNFIGWVSVGDSVDG